MKIEAHRNIDIKELSSLFACDQNSQKEMFYQIRKATTDTQYDYFENRECHYLQAREAGELIGNISIYRVPLLGLEKNHCYLGTDFYIHPQFRSQLNGRKLLDFFVEYYQILATNEKAVFYAAENHPMALANLGNKENLSKLDYVFSCLSTLHLVERYDHAELENEIEICNEFTSLKSVQLNTKLLKPKEDCFHFYKWGDESFCFQLDRCNRQLGLSPLGRQKLNTQKHRVLVGSVDFGTCSKEKWPKILKHLSSVFPEIDYFALRDEALEQKDRKSFKAMSFVTRFIWGGPSFDTKKKLDKGIGVFAL